MLGPSIPGPRYMFRTVLKKMGGLGATENGGFQGGHSREKQGILELKITKKRIFFCPYKWSLGSAQRRQLETNQPKFR